MPHQVTRPLVFDAIIKVCACCDLLKNSEIRVMILKKRIIFTEKLAVLSYASLFLSRKEKGEKKEINKLLFISFSIEFLRVSIAQTLRIYNCQNYCETSKLNSELSYRAYNLLK